MRVRRAIVVGGGIGGLTTAIALRRKGIEVSVYERAPQLGEVGAGITLWPNATRALINLGVAAELIAEARRFAFASIRKPDGSVISRNSPAAIERFFDAPCVAVHRADLHAALVASLPSNILNSGAECISVESSASKSRVFFKDGRSDEADVVVGADGIRSAVRAAILPQIRTRYAGYTAWRGIAQVGGIEETSETWGHGARFGIVPLSRDRVYWFATENAPAGTILSEEQRIPALLDRFGRWHEPISRLIGSTNSEHLLRNDIHDIAPFSPWSSGRVVLLGDAAHPTTPNLGQGACMAIESAVALAEELGANEADVGIRRYEARRMKRTAEITNMSWRIGRMAQMESGVGRAVRDLALRAIPASLSERQVVSLIARPI
jgi:2-polyprenyl-6-methoxyphenol hydroxylase-like FAD-dependent oxidoreductase